jgi:hypothetical protein
MDQRRIPRGVNFGFGLSWLDPRPQLQEAKGYPDILAQGKIWNLGTPDQTQTNF